MLLKLYASFNAHQLDINRAGIPAPRMKLSKARKIKENVINAATQKLNLARANTENGRRVLVADACFDAEVAQAATEWSSCVILGYACSRACK